jgi:hypothetical protein
MRKVRLPFAAIVMACSVVHGCNRGPVSPYPANALSEKVESAHYVYYYNAGDTVDTGAQEEYHAWATSLLDIFPTRKIVTYKYRDTAQLNQVLRLNVGPGSCLARPERFEVHCTVTWNDHEVVHVLVSLIGQPPSYFNEGLAVALSVNRRGRNFDETRGWWQNGLSHARAREHSASGNLIPIREVLETSAWNSRDARYLYPQSGSFVSFLIDRHGVPPLRELVHGSKWNDPGHVTEERFQAVFGFSIYEAERAWHDFLR